MSTLSILIPSLVDRAGMLKKLCEELYRQSEAIGRRKDFQICIYVDNRQVTTGEKRNQLLIQADHEYVAFFDDDDEPLPNYLEEIFKAIDQNPDVVGFDGYMTTNGKDPIPWQMSKRLPYKTIKVRGTTVMYHRYNNHLCPIKKEIALAIKFPDKNFQEDYDYAYRLNCSGLIESEVYINKELYHYKYIEKK